MAHQQLYIFSLSFCQCVRVDAADWLATNFWLESWVLFIDGSVDQLESALESGGVLVWLSVWSKVQIGFTFLVPAHLGTPGKKDR